MEDFIYFSKRDKQRLSISSHENSKIEAPDFKIFLTITLKWPPTSSSQVKSRFYAYADIFLFGSKSHLNDLCLQATTEVKKIRPNVKLIYVRAEYTPMKVALATPIINVSGTKLAKNGHPDRGDRRYVIYQSLSYRLALQSLRIQTLCCRQCQNIPRA